VLPIGAQRESRAAAPQQPRGSQAILPTDSGGTPMRKTLRPRTSSAAVQTPLETYLREINETALLSAEQEKELSHRISAGENNQLKKKSPLRASHLGEAFKRGERSLGTRDDSQPGPTSSS